MNKLICNINKHRKHQIASDLLRFVKYEFDYSLKPFVQSVEGHIMADCCGSDNYIKIGQCLTATYEPITQLPSYGPNLLVRIKIIN